MNTILIIDDEATLRILLSRILELEGYEVYQAKDRMSGLRQLQQHEIDVVLCDVFLPDGNGVDMIPELKKSSPHSMIILLTAHGNIADGVQAIKNGAFDYIVKGDDNRKIIPLVSRAMDELRKGKSSERVIQADTQPGFETIVGNSVSLSKVMDMARKVAVTDVCVLLNGETGTGKEVFARAIHAASHRKDKPFVAINCSAFSKELLESELFGHKAGAFTGALKDKKGLFEEADGGTLFLDEIGEMEFCLQAKLLRVLETHEFIKVGSWNYNKDKVLLKNIHNEVEIKVFRTQEVLYIVSGKIEAEIYDLNEKFIEKIEVSEGEILILLNSGHGYKILEDNTKVIEIKNGPYLGAEIDRRRF